eukprot:GFYU01019451.1.p1 GENE.GFYU01019451.1~~GFYU01019451.1.p1  ORF type:complete len:436 (-),score=76.22 GFYU01019451.1:109-1416(-)
MTHTTHLYQHLTRRTTTPHTNTHVDEKYGCTHAKSVFPQVMDCAVTFALLCQLNRDCKVVNNKGGGVELGNASTESVISKTSINKNSGPGVLSGGTKVVIQETQISNCLVGIELDNRSVAHISTVDIMGCANGAVSGNSATINMQKTYIRGNGGHAVKATRTSRLEIAKSTFEFNDGDGVGVYDSVVLLSDVSVSRNHNGIILGGRTTFNGVEVHVTESAQTACKVMGTTRVEAKKCSFSTNHGKGVEISDRVYGVFSQCTIEGNLKTGFEVTGEADVTLTDSQVRRNEEHGVDIAGSSVGRLERVRMEYNAVWGALIRGGSSVTLEECAVCHNVSHGGHVFDTAKVEIKDSVFSDNGHCGICLLNDASGSMSGGSVERNDSGVRLEGLSTLSMSTLISSNNNYGVFLIGPMRLELDGVRYGDGNGKTNFRHTVL